MKNWPNQWLRFLRLVRRPQTVIAIAAALLLIVDTFIKPLSTVALGLIVLGLSPWIVKYVTRVRLPGGTEVEFKDDLARVTEDAKQAGLLVEPEDKEQRHSVYESLLDDDPTLSLAKLRIELERRLVELAETAGMLPLRAGGINRLASELNNAQVLTDDQFDVIRNLVPLLNAAVHSQEYSAAAAEWAIDVGPRLLFALDQRTNEIRALHSPPDSQD